MTRFKLRDLDKGNENTFDDKETAEEQKANLESMGVECELEVVDDGASSNGDSSERAGDSATEVVEPVESPTENEGQSSEAHSGSQEPHPIDEHPQGTQPYRDYNTPEKAQEPVETQPVNPESLSKDPIGFLESVNTEFVNTIKGKPAISKQGFRFIQREFEISTESEVVQWIDDPLGVVVWAKAELPNGYSAEAHGEGYQFEKDVSDNEFVRYADTRAKNRALSDLTSAGALAVSELQGGRE